MHQPNDQDSTRKNKGNQDSIRKNYQDSIRRKQDILRTLVCRESDLINNRITWLLASQTILFVAFSNFFKESESPRLPLFVIVGLGLLISVSSSSGLNLSRKAIHFYREKYDNELNNPSDAPLPFLDFDIEKKEEEEKETQSRRFLLSLRGFWLPWRLLPWLFFTAWISMLVFIALDS
ncbi:MAG: hypothetical protein AAGD25_36825 [Cyanobacteria bacterium P01_F01_bin.150]